MYESLAFMIEAWSQYAIDGIDGLIRYNTTIVKLISFYNFTDIT